MFIYESTPLLIYTCVLTTVFGAVMGSFLNCAAWRIAHKESVVKGRSHCPDCGHTLGVLDLFPVFSWIFLGGKCRYCKKPISARYPLTELFMGAMSLLCLLQEGLGLSFARDLFLLFCLFTLSLVDLEIYEIPDICLLLPAIAWLLTAPFLGYSIKTAGMHIAAGLVFGAAILALSILMDRILGKESMGGGDIKLFALMGLYLGFASSLFALLLSCLIGLVFVAIRKNSKIPFGPSIALATWVMLLYGGGFVDWYLSLF